MFYIRTHLDHVKTYNPMSHNISAGAAYGDYQIDVGLQVGDDGKGSYSGMSYALWGVDPQRNNNQKIAAEFTIRKGSGPNLDYKLLTKLEIPYLEPIQVGGTLVIDPSDRSVFALNWANGVGQNYTLDLNYKAANHQYEIAGLLRMNKLLYKCDIALQNDAKKKIQIDLVANKHYYLNVEATNMFKNVGFEFYWDMDNDKKQSLKFDSVAILEAGKQPTVSMTFKLLGHDGTFKGELKPQGVESTIKYNGDNIVVKGNYGLGEKGIYGLGFSITSSIVLIKDISFMANVKAVKNPQTDRYNLLELDLDAKWNDQFKHSIGVEMKKKGMAKISGKFDTTSSYKQFNGVSAKFDYTKPGNEMQTSFSVMKESQKIVQIDFKNKNDKLLKNGVFLIETSSNAFKSVKIIYDLNMANEMHFKGEIDHNQGANKVEADVKLGLKADEKKLQFLIVPFFSKNADGTQWWGQKVNGSFELKGNDFSKKLFTSANLHFGKCRGEFENDYSSSYNTDAVGLRLKDRDDVFKLNSKLFTGCDGNVAHNLVAVTPLNFMLSVKSIEKYQQGNRFPEKRDVSFSHSLSLGTAKITNIVFNGKTVSNKNAEIKLRGDILDGKHEFSFLWRSICLNFECVFLII